MRADGAGRGDGSDAGRVAGEWWTNTGQEQARRTGPCSTVGIPTSWRPATMFLHDVPPAVAAEAVRHVREQSSTPFERPGRCRRGQTCRHGSCCAARPLLPGCVPAAPGRRAPRHRRRRDGRRPPPGARPPRRASGTRARLRPPTRPGHRAEQPSDQHRSPGMTPRRVLRGPDRSRRDRFWPRCADRSTQSDTPRRRRRSRCSRCMPRQGDTARVQRTHPSVATHARRPTPRNVKMLASTPTLPDVAMLPATATLPDPWRRCRRPQCSSRCDAPGDRNATGGQRHFRSRARLLPSPSRRPTTRPSLDSADSE